ncbi:MAG: hypothetical protein ACOYB4_04310 [Methyloceanibacter sp.]
MRLAAGFACALVLGGCGGVQLEGKVFDYMGVSGDRKESDVRMSERPPLLLPPNLNALPQPGAPGSSVAAATARQDWPDDPERVKKRVIAEKKAQEAAKTAKADPLHPYAGKPTLLDKLFARETTEVEPVADVPEPDPSDRIPETHVSETGVATARPQPLTPHVPHTPVQDKEPFKPTGSDTYGRVSNPSGAGQPGVGF